MSAAAGDGEALRALEQRLARFEALREIEQLVYRYAELCDQSYAPDALADLFTEDAVWSSATPDGAIDFGTQRGREAIRANFAQMPSEVGLPTLHVAVAPQVVLAADGQTAVGKWRTLVLLSQPEPRTADAAATFLGANYEHAYRLTEGRWLFERVAAFLDFNIPLIPAAPGDE